ncbi:MAG: nuclear transport factor 2 family protein [Cyclobacteriaceae bacterium]|nr:nuclear transport factor 2 family protein [Cyclobacteriaceae bacterium]
MRTVIIIFLLAASLTSQAQTPEEAAISAIKKLSEKFSSDYMNSDFQAIANAYTEDAVILSPGKDVIVGRKAIFDFWNGLPRTSKLLMHRIEPDTIFLVGNEIQEYGYYYAQSQKPGEEASPVFSAKYFIIWKKDEAGNWKMKMDMWNGRNPDWSK